ncbi:MAG TPA: hypothetical protein VNQ77_05795 [Frankiaceae bacterium]|nr:hypothetical protein [Frankiaceae bacterium]
MATELWGVGADARRPGRPVVACAALGVAAFALTFVGALVLGRGLAGSALAALLLPLALSGALAVGLAVAFVVAVALEQPYGARRVGRLVTVATPLAALVALFAYAGAPGGGGGLPLALGGPTDIVLGTPRTPQRAPRVVRVPPAVTPPVAPETVPDPAPPVAAPPVSGPVLSPPDVVPERPVVAPRATPDRTEAGPERKVRRVATARKAFRAATTGGRTYAAHVDDPGPAERCAPRKAKGKGHAKARGKGHATHHCH